MSKKALITGCNGFVGKWLAHYLNDRTVAVTGIDLQPTTTSQFVFGTYYQSDIIDTPRIASIIATEQPDCIFNLAGVTFLPEADASPKSALDANISGTMAILDAIVKYSRTTRILLIGSSREYANRSDETGIAEHTPPDPANFYGISKYTSELIGLQYHRQFGIDVRCTRSFNHTGPGQSPRFVCSEWARHLVRIALDKELPELLVGALETVIDFSDVRDVVAAYVQIIEKGAPGAVYNVCSGRGTSLQWILTYLLQKVNTTVTIKQPPVKIRTGEASLRMVGDHSKLTHDTGWQPTHTFEQTLDSLWEYWMQQEMA